MALVQATHKTVSYAKMAVDEWGLQKAYVLCNGNVEQDGRIRYIPWYLLMFIKQKEQAHLRVEW